MRKCKIIAEFLRLRKALVSAYQTVPGFRGKEWLLLFRESCFNYLIPFLLLKLNSSVLPIVLNIYDVSNYNSLNEQQIQK